MLGLWVSVHMLELLRGFWPVPRLLLPRAASPLPLQHLEAKALLVAEARVSLQRPLAAFLAELRMSRWAPCCCRTGALIYLPALPQS